MTTLLSEEIGLSKPEQARAAIAEALNQSSSACVTCSFQAEDMVVLRIVQEVIPEVPVLFLDTGYHFPELYAYRDEMAAKYKEGPVAMMTVFPNGTPALPKFLGIWFVYCLVISFFVAYLAGRTMTPGAPYPAVFRAAGTAAFLAYGLSQLSNGIWKGQPWSVTLKEVIDGLLYGLLTGGTFGWLWPR